jgi:hypothetical protein
VHDVRKTRNRVVLGAVLALRIEEFVAHREFTLGVRAEVVEYRRARVIQPDVLTPNFGIRYEFDVGSVGVLVRDERPSIEGLGVTKVLGKTKERSITELVIEGAVRKVRPIVGLRPAREFFVDGVVGDVVGGLGGFVADPDGGSETERGVVLRIFIRSKDIVVVTGRRRQREVQVNRRGDPCKTDQN